MKTKLKRIPITFLVTFLFTFMLLIFGPSEIFFANVTEFKFVYGEFAGHLAMIAAAAALFVTGVINFLPDMFYKICIAVIFGLSLAGYLQVMFFNKQLDLLGLNPEGYQASVGIQIWNLILWIMILAVVIGVFVWKKEMAKKIVVYGSSFLLCIQMVALGSLFLTAKESAFERQEIEGAWHLSGENQYTVSEKQNVIVLVLDWFSNGVLGYMEQAYPGSTGFLHDFTYYNNVDCNYFGTYPSLPRMLTGNKLDMSLGINEWLQQSWSNENTEMFYETLQEYNYVTNVYTPDIHVLCGTNDTKMLEGKLSNVVNSAQDISVDYNLLYKTMSKMSAYRMSPEFLKSKFYTRMDEYEDIVITKENPIMHNNYDFYATLKEKGLKTDKTSNYYIVQHLQGRHERTTDIYGNFKENATQEETAKGCMTIVEEYLNQLKALGVYDDATIIITSDHGSGSTSNAQVIFYMKEPGEQHEESPVTNAPISLNEYFPTIAETVGMDYLQFGQSIHDFSENELRERTFWLRNYNDQFPEVPYYTGSKNGTTNVYYGYTYTGNKSDLEAMGDEGYTQVVEMVDSFF